MKELFANLNEFSKTLDEKKKTVLGFFIDIDENTRFNLLKKGWWHIFYFASDNAFQYGMRIFPNKDWKDWSVMQTSLNETSYTYALNIGSFFYFKKMNVMSNPKVFNEIKINIDILEKYASPFLDFVKGKGDLDFFKKYLQLDSNIPKNENCRTRIYQDFWDYFDKSEGYIYLKGVIEQMLQNKSFIPNKLPSFNMGIWETRINNILAQRAYILNEEFIEFNEVEPFLWNSFKQPHAYDSEEIYFDYFPNPTAQTRHNLDGVVELLNADFYDHNKIIKENPLNAALVGMDGNLHNYTGVQHIEAAAIFDLEYNDPVTAWNCLVSAAYWSGLNSNETFIPAWEAAIELCDKNNWKDAFEALSYQLEFYNEYKRKNNII